MEQTDSPLARPFLLRGDPPPRLRETVVERVSWTPTKLACSERDVEDAPLELAEPRGRELGFAPAAGHPLDGLVQLEHRRLDAGADVEHAARVAPERREHRPDDVQDVDVVARLAPVTVDLGGAT